MGLKLGTMSPRLNGETALKVGMTPKVGKTWKLSSFSKTSGRSVRLAPTPRSESLVSTSDDSPLGAETYCKG